MSYVELVFLALALSMDAFAVSLANGMVYKNLRFQHSLFISFTFGFFQALMPIIGYFAGAHFIQSIEKFDHWIAAALLWFLSIKMILEGVKKHTDSCDVKGILSIKDIFVQGIATSIDALVVGLSLAAINISIVSSSIIIGTITFAVCLIAVFIGKKTSGSLGNKAEIVGGIVLFAIGMRILLSN